MNRGTYRLQKISEIQQEIEREREKICKKYIHGIKIITNADDTIAFAVMRLEAAGIRVLSTIAAAPITIAMDYSALLAAMLLIAVRDNKYIAMKAEKHVSDEEYSLILADLEKFNSMKEEIRNIIGEQRKQSLINQLRRKLE